MNKTLSKQLCLRANLQNKFFQKKTDENKTNHVK